MNIRYPSHETRSPRRGLVSARFENSEPAYRRQGQYDRVSYVVRDPASAFRTRFSVPVGIHTWGPNAVGENVRNLPDEPVPPICILEFDGDVTDWLIQQGVAEPFPFWPCFPTTMYSVETGGTECEIVARSPRSGLA